MIDYMVGTENPISELTRLRLQGVRRNLLRLHRSSLEVERIAYEQVYGCIESRQELRQLTVQHPWFAWLRSIAELVLQIDIALDKEQPECERNAHALVLLSVQMIRRERGLCPKVMPDFPYRSR